MSPPGDISNIDILLIFDSQTKRDEIYQRHTFDPLPALPTDATLLFPDAFQTSGLTIIEEYLKSNYNVINIAWD